MSYVVLARKSRPQTFEDVVDQEHITRTLLNAVKSGRLAHAYLFAGPRGVGKTTVARVLAKAVNCKKPEQAEPCNTCTNCVEISEGIALDVIEIDGASNRGINEVRDLQENVRFVPSSCTYKVYIVDEVHMLTMEAFNAFLKTLEEPPAHVLFIFATTEAHKVPATILSRCQRFDFRRIAQEKIAQRLRFLGEREKIQIDQEAIQLIAKSVQGSLRDALSILDQAVSFSGGKVNFEDVRSLLGGISQKALSDFADSIAERDTRGGVTKIQEMVNQGVDLYQFTTQLCSYFRDILIIHIGGDSPSLIDLPEADIKKLQEQSRKFTKEHTLQIINTLAKIQDKMKWSDDRQLILEIGLANATIPFVSLDEVLEKIEMLQNRLGERNTVAYEKKDIDKPKPFKKTEVSSEVPEKNKSGIHEKTVPTGSIKQQWAAVTKEVKKNKASLAAFLKDAFPVIDSRGVVTLQFSKDKKFVKESVERQENKEIVEKAIACILQKQCRGRCVLSDLSLETNDFAMQEEDTDEELDKQDTVVREALDMFQGELVNDVSLPTESNKID